jgi:hypothetical protein
VTFVRFRTDGVSGPALFFDWSPLVSQRRERAMSTRDKRTSSLKDHLIQDAENLRRQAQQMPPGVRRDELLRKARQAETAAHVHDWLASPGLQLPK